MSREELYKTKTTVSKDKTKTSVPRCRKVDDPLNAVASKTDSTILEQDDIYKASMDSNLDSGTSPSKHRLRRFFNCNDQFLIVSEVFLGNEIKSIDVTHIERNDNSIAFSGKRILGVTYGQHGEIRATRKFSEIIISGYTVKFIQDGFNNYLIALVEPERDNYRRLVAFLEGLGIPVRNVGSLPKQAAMPKSSEAVVDDLTALSEFKETLKQYLHINPDPANNKQTLKALQAHKLIEQYIGKVLVHLNTSILRGKNGIIIFEKGFLMSDLFCEEHLFYFGNPGFLSNKSWLKMWCEEENIVFDVKAYCGKKGRIISFQYILSRHFIGKEINFAAKMESLLVRLDSIAESLSRTVNSAIDQLRLSFFYSALKPLISLPEDLYDNVLGLRTPYVKQIDILRESLGMMPIPSEMIFLLNFGPKQSILFSAYGLHIIRQDSFPIRARSSVLNVPWKNLEMIMLEPAKTPSKTAILRISAPECSRFDKIYLDCSALPDSLAASSFAENMNRLVGFIREISGKFGRL